MTENGKILVSGIVFGKNDLRIVNIDGYHLDIKPAKTILLTFHQDKPEWLPMLQIFWQKKNKYWGNAGR